MTSQPPQNLPLKAYLGPAQPTQPRYSRESDLNERIAKVAHPHVEGPFGPGSVVQSRGWELIRRSSGGCSPVLLVFSLSSLPLMLIPVWNCFSNN